MTPKLVLRKVGHPGPKTKWRDDSWIDDERRLAKGYHERNRDIVEECGVLLAAPRNLNDQTGGTWHTIEHAKKSRKDDAGFVLEIFGP